MATLSDETCFGDLFKRFAPFLKMYVEYCTQHENTASRVSLIAAKNDKFGNLLHVSWLVLAWLGLAWRSLAWLGVAWLRWLGLA